MAFRGRVHVAERDVRSGAGELPAASGSRLRPDETRLAEERQQPPDDDWIGVDAPGHRLRRLVLGEVAKQREDVDGDHEATAGVHEIVTMLVTFVERSQRSGGRSQRSKSLWPA